MLERLTLRNACLLVEVLPQAGGGLARLDWLGGPEAAPLLRPLAGDSATPPLPSQLACFPLLPWSNRMAPSGFAFGGHRYVPAPTRAGEPCPIHGDAWLQAWQVEAHTAGSVRLSLERRTATPFSYSATLDYRLDGAALVVELTVTNRGLATLPFGAGLHPWMPAPREALLTARFDGVWLAGPDKLPRDYVAAPAQWRFDGAAALPQGVDNVFAGWDGRARIAWPRRGVALEIEADMDYCILYVPAGRDFFCVEPVDHPINAHNLPGQPGLSLLAPGAALVRRWVFRGADL